MFGRNKDCLNCLILHLTIVGGKENHWFLDALKCSISELILPEKTWKRIKTVFFKIEITTYISELQNLGVEITAPNSTWPRENLAELLRGFLHPYSFPNNPIIKDKRILILLSKNSIIDSFSLIQKKTILRNILKFLKEKFNHMGW